MTSRNKDMPDMDEAGVVSAVLRMGAPAALVRNTAEWRGWVRIGTGMKGLNV